MAEKLEARTIHDRLAAQFGDAIIEFQENPLNPASKVAPAALLDICTWLAMEPDLYFDSLMCVSGVDYGVTIKLGVVYNLFSMHHRHACCLKVDLPRDNPHVPSIAHLWRVGDWLERETFDMYGIHFDGHPDHRRILCPDDWEGWPLRKDYVVQEYYHGVKVPYSFNEGDRSGTVIIKKGLEE
jgi:NADH-quinone oxidoreductase subunit C